MRPGQRPRARRPDAAQPRRLPADPSGSEDGCTGRLAITRSDERRRVLTPLDLGLVLLVTALIRWLSGAQRFTFLHTPDSEFYYSLGAFGSAVTDRAPFDSYFWTKLGVVLPVHALTQVMPPLAALDTFHVALLALITGSGYVVARLRWSRLGACAAGAFVALNTVVLGFVGDPYASGTAIAALSVLIATASVWALSERPFRWWLAALMGVVGAWLVMINPYALIVGASGCAGLILAELRAAGRSRLAASAAALLAGFGLAFGVFLALGARVFPGLNWYASLHEFLTNNDLANWAAKDWAWLPSETSLLVPAVAAVVGLIAVVLAQLGRGSDSGPDLGARLTRAGAALIWVTLIVAVVYKIVSASNVIEHSVYSSMLWPTALLSLVLVASATAEPDRGWARVAVAGGGAVAWIVTGHWTSDISTPTALTLATLVVVAVGALLAWARGDRYLLSAARPVAAAGLVCLILLGSAFQVLQNGRPLDPTNLHRRVLYELAFVPSDSGSLLAQDTEVQAWLLQATSPDEQLLVWNETDTRSAASMQLWGPNTAGTGFDGPLGDAGMDQIRSVRPDALVAYAGSRTAIGAIRAELEAEWIVTPTCQEFPGDDQIPPMQVCILRLAERG